MFNHARGKHAGKAAPTHARKAGPKHARERVRKPVGSSRAAGRLLAVAAGVAWAVLGGPVSASPVHVSAEGDRVVAVASRYAGDPYLWSATSPAGFDCSGYVQYLFRIAD